MNRSAIRIKYSLVTALVIALAGAIEADAQTDLSGDWVFTVTTDDSGVTTPAVTLEQDGETLTGHYSSEGLGEADFTGSVSGSEITFSFSADVFGQLVQVVYSGTVGEDGGISGTMDIAGGFLVGTFTAARAEN